MRVQLRLGATLDEVGSSMSRAHPTDRHNAPAKAMAAKPGAPVGAGLQSGKPLNAAEIPGDIL
jgi:hypothetical protein